MPPFRGHKCLRLLGSETKSIDKASGFLMSTKFLSTAKAQEERKWVLFDADSKVIGRLATQVAATLRGKNNPSFTPNQDCGDFVVVINAEKAVFTGNKKADKVYFRHSGYVGGLKDETANELMERAPEEVIRRAVKGMLPRTNLGREQLKKLKVYSGSEHPHAAQQPQPQSN